MLSIKQIGIGVWYQLIIGAILFISNILLTRFISIEARGQFAIFTNAIAVASIWVGLGIHSAAQYYSANKLANNNTILRNAFKLLGITSMVLIVATFTLISLGKGHWINAISNNNWVYIAFVVTSISTALFQIAMNICFGNDAYILPFKYLLVYAVASMLGIAISIYFLQETQLLISTLIINMLIYIAICIALLFKVNKINYLANVPSTKASFSLWQYSKLAFACNAIQVLAYRLDIWYMHTYATKETASYSIAVLLLQLLWILPGQVATQNYTSFIDRNDGIKNLIKVHSKYVWLSLALYLLALLLGSVFIPLLFGKNYNESISLFNYLLLGGFAINCALLISSYNAANNKLKQNLIGSAIGLVVCIIGMPYCIQNYGAKGAAILSSISYISNALYLYIQFIIKHHISFLQLVNPNNK
jgi:O-antigen/teichoic acid export membrane protein